MSEEIKIVQINCTDDEGIKEPPDRVQRLCRRLGELLKDAGAQNYIIIPKFGSLYQVEIASVSKDIPIIINIDGDMKKISAEEMVTAINKQLREKSDTEDGIQ